LQDRSELLSSDGFSVAALPGHSANATYSFKRAPDETTKLTDVESLLEVLASQSCVACGKPPSLVKPVSRLNLLASLASINHDSNLTPTCLLYYPLPAVCLGRIA